MYMSTESLIHGPDGHEHGPGFDSKASRETRLHTIRRQAELHGRVASTGIRADGAPLPVASAETGYYGIPLLKRPQWSWEVPLYFFTGGAAGAASIISACAHATGADEKLIRDARWLAAIAGAVSPPLLIADLGMPRRFLNMMRVFKVQSPMSVGSWTLLAFSSSAAWLAFMEAAKNRNGDVHGLAVRVLTNASEFLAAASGLVLSTYTGVLLGATAVPVWNEHRSMLPIHFAASGLNSAVSILELRGHSSPALNALGVLSAATETVIGARIELNQRRATSPLKRGRSGWLTRIGGLLSGPLPLALRLIAGVSSNGRSVKLKRAAAVSSIAGSLLTRYAWLAAGKASAENPTIPLALDHEATPPRALNDRLGESAQRSA
jgi:formate-dependent nitrite reductase membrane component NrfD